MQQTPTVQTFTPTVQAPITPSINLMIPTLPAGVNAGIGPGNIKQAINEMIDIDK